MGVEKTKKQAKNKIGAKYKQGKRSSYLVPVIVETERREIEKNIYTKRHESPLTNPKYITNLPILLQFICSSLSSD
jgi:hypothetical protein